MYPFPPKLNLYIKKKKRTTLFLAYTQESQFAIT